MKTLSANVEHPQVVPPVFISFCWTQKKTFERMFGK